MKIDVATVNGKKSPLSGIGLSEYIRRRRLTLAALDIKDTGLKIIDIDVKYGYDSADSFSRAFYSMHGILPSEARSENAHQGGNHN